MCQISGGNMRHYLLLGSFICLFIINTVVIAFAISEIDEYLLNAKKFLEYAIKNFSKTDIPEYELCPNINNFSPKINLTYTKSGNNKYAIDKDEDIKILLTCSNTNQRFVYKYNYEKNLFILPNKINCSEKLFLNIESNIFASQSLHIKKYDKPVIDIQMKFSKPLLYVVINPSDKMNISHLSDRPNNFVIFKKRFLNMLKVLDGNSKVWKNAWCEKYFYSLHYYGETHLLCEEGNFKTKWDSEHVLNKLHATSHII